MKLGVAIGLGLRASGQAVQCAVSHGQMRIGEETISVSDLSRPVSDFEGDFVTFYDRRLRIQSTRVSPENEQLRLRLR